MQDIKKNIGQWETVAGARETGLEELESTIRSYTTFNRSDADKHTKELSPEAVQRPLLSTEATCQEDDILVAQKTTICSTVQRLFQLSKEFVGLFIPYNCEHSVAKKIWGSVDAIWQDAISDLEEFDDRATAIYIIRPPPENLDDLYQMEQPSHLLENCPSCSVGNPYRSKQNAVAHLKSSHFHYSSFLHRLAHLEHLMGEQYLLVLETCLTYLRALQIRAEKIHADTLLDTSTNRGEYQLPNDLVDCFEATVMFLMQADISFSAIKDEMRHWRYIKRASIKHLRTPVVANALEQLLNFGKSARAAMTRAEKSLALSDPRANAINMAMAGPELLVSVICQNIQKRQLMAGSEMDVNEHYQSYASKLQYQINHLPGKRLLRDIHRLQEELSAVKSVNAWQRKMYTNYLEVLDHRSFQRPSANRVTMFLYEAEFLQNNLKVLEAKATELDALDARTQQLREQLKQSVEILEEDHGKAILIFTTITTIFLPLSFVTSFFGMNTADIRNTNKNQGFFWAIAIPITVTIVGTAVLLAYYGDKLYDATFEAFRKLREDFVYDIIGSEKDNRMATGN
ncbi:hypothetical protein BDV95DRAFT_627032 [Massariosphaeria phaeospora]|uniref:DUF7896 domain-containing protein n=1 Tax=Massariosphaeria phaeospora TaxID=100035 RepID=A0A7C8MBG4_9PLEO|nr:hypothetical protein BDV95DRAFT_627032 [Massariosphaeria phaeospora]